jgi:hypothetical protein
MKIKVLFVSMLFFTASAALARDIGIYGGFNTGIVSALSKADKVKTGGVESKTDYDETDAAFGPGVTVLGRFIVGDIFGFFGRFDCMLPLDIDVKQEISGVETETSVDFEDIDSALLLNFSGGVSFSLMKSRPFHVVIDAGVNVGYFGFEYDDAKNSFLTFGGLVNGAFQYDFHRHFRLEGGLSVPIGLGRGKIEAGALKVKPFVISTGFIPYAVACYRF